jgi:uncharacterized repeat protein (TIGR03803 family)
MQKHLEYFRKMKFFKNASRTAIVLMQLLVSSACIGDTIIITNLYSFGISPDAWGPRNTLTQNTNGIFYSVTPGGGPTGDGAIFAITPKGAFTNLVYFSRTNGSVPRAGLIQGTDGNLYGTTFDGGMPDINGDTLGTVFQVTPSGILTSLFSFSGTNGWGPGGPGGALVEGSDGYFYGTTQFGGPTYNPITYPYNYGYGTIFKISTNGILTTLVSFNGTNGSNPVGALLEVTNGVFYGTTSSGGVSNLGTVFQITTNGILTTLASFNGTNGSAPQAGLIRGRDGCFYGTTLNGGTFTNQSGNRPFGTIFKMNSNGMLNSLYSFSGGPNDGYNPYDALLQSTDGSLYGTTWGGGAYDMGVIFRVTTTGVLTALYSFHAYFALPRDGGQPYAGLVQGADGYFYGTTHGAGAYGGGTFFRFSIPPTLQMAVRTNKTMAFNWNSVIDGQYQLQYVTNLNSTDWINLGSTITATNSTVNTSDFGLSDSQRFYRLQLFQ